MEKRIVYISLILVLVALPTLSWGQYLTKVTDPSFGTNVLILNSEGMPPVSVWEFGRKLRDKATGATIRHSLEEGNGNNLDVNSKLPFRFIIAPNDARNSSSVTGIYFDWASAMGFNAADNNNLNARATIPQRDTGCRSYIPPIGQGYPPHREWRLPTQRELDLIWLFRDIINQSFTASGYEPLSGSYWSSTESTASGAFSVDFTHIQLSKRPKTDSYKVRCVSDY